MINVLYISYDGMTDPLGQSQVLPYLQELTKEGFHFTILSFEKKQRLEKEGALIRSITEKAGIEWVPLSFTSKPPVISKIYDRFRLWKKAVSLYKKNGFKIVHCRSYVAAEAGLRLKKKYGVKFLFDMRGFWADEKVDNGQWDLSKPFFKRIYNYYKKKEKEFLLQADGIVTLTKASKSYLLSQPGYEKLNLEVIPCCADLEHFDYHNEDKIKGAALRKQLGIPNESKVVTYLGSVGGWYMTKEMFRFFALLLRHDSLYHMLILTKDEPTHVKEEATFFGIPSNKISITYSDRINLPQYLALSKFSIFFIRNTFSKIASSPTKHAELMGMGIPVVCNDIGDTGHIITDTGSGIIINDFDEISIANAIRDLETFEILSKEKIRSEALKYFDLHSGSNSYYKLYKRLV